MINWQTKKLSEVLIKASSNVSQNQLKDEDGIFPIYGAGGFIKNISFYHQDKEYIGIVKDGAGIGRTTLLPAKSSVIGTSQYLLPRSGFDIKFLYYFVSSIDFLKYKNGSTIPHIYFKDYSEEPILVPILFEQHRIVKILDEFFESIGKAKENAEKNLQNSKELFESYLQDAFASPGKGWKGKKLDEVCDLITCGVAARPHYVENGIPFLSAKNVKNGKIIWKGFRFISEKTHKELTKNNKPLLGDILYTRVGSYGEAAVVDKSIDFSVFVSLTLIKPDKNLLYNHFLKFYLNTNSIKQLAMRSISGSGVGNLNVGTVRNFPIFIPPLAEQKSIVKKLDALSAETKKLEAIYKQKIADLAELKKSVLKKAFSGEL